VARLEPPPRLIVNPRAGHKLGMPTNAATLDLVETALTEAGLRCDVQLTHSPRHATQLAREAVRDGCKLVIAAGGDGTVAEAGEGLVHTDAALGIMPLGSIMNMARALCIPRDLKPAALTIAEGHTIAMDVGRVQDHIFLEAGGIGLAAGLFGYFNRLDSGKGHPRRVLLAMLRFMRNLRNPRLVIVADGRRFDVRAPQVTVSNGPYVGAAYALAPEARLDDGLLDVVIFRGMSVFRVLVCSWCERGRSTSACVGGDACRSTPTAMWWAARRRTSRCCPPRCGSSSAAPRGCAPGPGRPRWPDAPALLDAPDHADGGRDLQLAGLDRRRRGRRGRLRRGQLAHGRDAAGI
jgi:YegS/Rv2252/BmrU family lipid kinase